MALVLLAAVTCGQTVLVSRITTIKRGGGRLDWSARTGLLAFDQKGPDGYYELYVMEPSGGGERCLTCARSELPRKHKGNPEWHPSGNYIVFQAQREQGFGGGGRFGRRRGLGGGRGRSEPAADFFGEPGLGLQNDLWITDARGTRFWKLWESAPQGGGVLHAHFSAKGDRLLWSERIGRGQTRSGDWALKVADFSMDHGRPRLDKVRSFRPGAGRGLYESHGFDVEERKILFTAMPERGGGELGLDIYTLDLKTEALLNLTNSPEEWDEHAHFSPSGRKIVWMSSKGMRPPAQPMDLRADYWIMNADGSNKRRLTYFNEPGHAEYIEGGAVAADFAWSADGSRLAAYVIEDRRQQRSRMVMIELSGPQ